MKFCLQPTKSFPDGAPAREEYRSDAQHAVACGVYAREWRERYKCEGCRSPDCPQCSQTAPAAPEPQRPDPDAVAKFRSAVASMEREARHNVDAGGAHKVRAQAIADVAAVFCRYFGDGTAEAAQPARLAGCSGPSGRLAERPAVDVEGLAKVLLPHVKLHESDSEEDAAIGLARAAVEFIEKNGGRP